MHAKHSCVIWICSRERTFSHQSVRNRRIHLFDKFKQFFVRIGEHCASTHENIWLFRVLDHLYCRLKIFFIDLFVSLLRCDFFRLIFGKIGRYILWNVNQYGTRTALTCNPERFPDRISQFIDIFYNIIMFRNRHGDSRNIDFLETVLSKKGYSDVAGDCHNRNRIHIGSRNTCYKICRPRSACGQTYTDFSRCPGITVRRMRRPLLMGSQDVTDLVLVLIQRIIYIQNRTARISEYGIHTLLF